MVITVRVECMVGVKTRESYQQAREEVQGSNYGKDKTPNNQLKRQQKTAVIQQ